MSKIHNYSRILSSSIATLLMNNPEATPEMKELAGEAQVALNRIILLVAEEKKERPDPSKELDSIGKAGGLG